MANTLYSKFKQSLLSQSPSVDLDTDTIKVMLVKTSQTFDDTKQYVGDLTGGNIVARSAALSGISITSGVFNHSAVTLSAVTTGSTCAVVYYKDTGSDATSPLIGWYDTGTNMPVVTNGGDVTVTPDTGTNKVFKL